VGSICNPVRGETSPRLLYLRQPQTCK